MVVCATACLIVVVDYDLNLFYREGAFFWDAGLNNYYFSFANRWPLPIHPVYGFDRPEASYFSIHFSLFYYAASAIHRLVWFIPPAVYFSLWQGLFFAGLAAGAIILSSSAIEGFLAAFSGPALACLGFPVVETGMPTFILLFLAAHLRGKVWPAAIALAIALSIREDAGLHAGLLLALLAWARIRRREAWRADAKAALTCLAYSACAFLIQLAAFSQGPSRFRQVFLGDRPALPNFAHQAHIFLIDKAYATWPVLFLLAVSLVRRDPLLAVAPLAVLPWLALNFVAPTPGASHLANYAAFPILLVILWPAALHRTLRNGKSLQLAVSALSIATFVVLGRDNADDRPWRMLGDPDWAAIGADEARLGNAIATLPGQVLVDDAVLSLIPEQIGGGQWLLMWSKRRSAPDLPQVPDPDGVVYLPDAYDAAVTRRAIADCGLDRVAAIAGTRFLVNETARRSPPSPPTAASPGSGNCARSAD